MKQATVLQTLYHAILGLFNGRHSHQQLDSQTQDTPKVESVSQRQYFVSHIDDYCDCV